MMAEIGLSIEPISVLEEQMSNLSKAPILRNPLDITQEMQIVKNMLTHFYNYATSFAIQAREDDPSSLYIPFKTLHEWYQLMEKRLQLDPKLFHSSSTDYI
jgi:hypothetical protein